MATLLSNIQDVCLELGLDTPNAVVSSTDTTTKQLLALMNRVGVMLSTEAEWQGLTKEHRFQTVYYQYTGTTTAGSNIITGLSSIVGLSTDFSAAGEGIPADNTITAVGTTTATMSVPATATATGNITFGQVKYATPAGFDRIVNDTQYQGSWIVDGPDSPQGWQAIKTGVVGGAFTRFRIMGDKFVIWPMPTSNFGLGYEYMSKYWAASSSGSGKAKFTEDTDTSVFPDSLLILGTKLKFFETKGFDTTTLLSDFVRELSKFKGADGGASTLSLANNKTYPFPSIPDTGYGA